MPRTLLPPEYDLGFLRLHPDGSVTAAFHINYLLVADDQVLFIGYLNQARFVVRAAGSEPWTPVEFNDHILLFCVRDLQNARLSFPSAVRAAEAANTNTGFRFRRWRGATLLQASRSRKRQFFVHYGASWIESDSLDAFHLAREPQAISDYLQTQQPVSKGGV